MCSVLCSVSVCVYEYAVCVRSCVCKCVCTFIYYYVFNCVLCVHACPTVCRVSQFYTVSSKWTSLNSAYVCAEYACVCVGGQVSRCTQKLHIYTDLLELGNSQVSYIMCGVLCEVKLSVLRTHSCC